MPVLGRRGALLVLGSAAALSSPDAQAANESRPEAQRSFERHVFDFYWTWRRLSSNELRRSGLPRERGEYLREAMGGQETFTDWQMKVLQVGLDDEGYAYVALISTQETTPRTLLTSVAITSGDTLGQRLQPGSRMHKVAFDLVKGDAVSVSGNLFADESEGYRELGRILGKQMDVRMRFPQFCARYTDIRTV